MSPDSFMGFGSCHNFVCPRRCAVIGMCQMRHHKSRDDITWDFVIMFFTLLSFDTHLQN
jgi:hypothetical protein